MTFRGPEVLNDTFEKIQFQRLARYQTLQFRHASTLPLIALLLKPRLRPWHRLAAQGLVLPPV